MIIPIFFSKEDEEKINEVISEVIIDIPFWIFVVAFLLEVIFFPVLIYYLFDSIMIGIICFLILGGLFVYLLIDDIKRFFRKMICRLKKK